MTSQTNHYKAGVYLELQRFKNAKKSNRGLDFPLANLRALSALTALLDRHGYRGTQEAFDHEHVDYVDMEAPVVSFSWKDYLRLYYGRTGPFRGQQVNIAKKALRSVAKKKVRIAYYRKKGKNPSNTKWVTDYYKLIRLDKETNKIVTVAYHPIFIDNVYSFHTWKPVNLYQMVADYLQCNKVKKAVLLFLEWLMTKDVSVYEISKNDLIERLWLQETVKGRQKTRVEETLKQCFDTAVGLGYLDSQVEEDKFGNLLLRLNKENCSRISA